MARPLVAVTTYHREAGERPRFTLPAAYLDAAREAGAMPVLVAPGDAAPDEILSRVDGLLLTGGGDLDPVHGAAAHPATYFTCPDRDAFELALVRAALARDLPTLAICRGMQVLNVALGGTLHPHLPDHVGERIPHRVSQDEATGHAVEIAPDSALADTMGGVALDAVPSWHHQCVDRPGRGLRPVAWAPDGVIEALEAPAARRLLAVQWHPEIEPTGAPGRALFARWAAWAAE